LATSGDDRSDSVELGERRRRRSDGVGDADLDRGDVFVEAPNVGEVLGGESFPFDRDPVRASIRLRNSVR
jgi:hypothetical protein